MMCDQCKRKEDIRKEDEKEYYECNICGYLICEDCCRRQSKRCRKCETGRMHRA